MKGYSSHFHTLKCHCPDPDWPLLQVQSLASSRDCARRDCEMKRPKYGRPSFPFHCQLHKAKSKNLPSYLSLQRWILRQLQLFPVFFSASLFLLHTHIHIYKNKLNTLEEETKRSPEQQREQEVKGSPPGETTLAGKVMPPSAPSTESLSVQTLLERSRNRQWWGRPDSGPEMPPASLSLSY